MKLKSKINDAIEFAKKNTDKDSTKQIMHRKRSRDFVEKLAESFRVEYSNENFRTFSKHYAENKTEFGLNELLYDIAVCETDVVPSVRGVKEIRYITKNVWSVESEFAKDSQQAVYDFNKLVMSNSENKLFIAPKKEFKETLKAPANYCSGNVFLGIVPHPDEWDEKIYVSVYQFKNKDWESTKD